MSPAASTPDDTPAVDSLLQVRDMHKRFDRQVVLDGVSLHVNRGETLVVLGPSGAGKSVLLKCIVGLLRADAGAITWRRRRIDGLSERELAGVRREVGFLFQLGGLFDSMSVAQNVAFPLREHLGLKLDACMDRVQAVLDLVGMGEFLHAELADLSGGQQRRVALARAIVLEPTALLYDEPTTGLDPVRSDIVAQIIRRLQSELSLTAIVVTHDIALARKVADRMLLLNDGRVHVCDTAQAVLDSPDPIVRQFLEGTAPPLQEHT